MRSRSHNFPLMSDAVIRSVNQQNIAVQNDNNYLIGSEDNMLNDLHRTYYLSDIQSNYMKKQGSRTPQLQTEIDYMQLNGISNLNSLQGQAENQSRNKCESLEISAWPSKRDSFSVDTYYSVGQTLFKTPEKKKKIRAQNSENYDVENQLPVIHLRRPSIETTFYHQQTLQKRARGISLQQKNSDEKSTPSDNNYKTLEEKDQENRFNSLYSKQTIRKQIGNKKPALSLDSNNQVLNDFQSQQNNERTKQDSNPKTVKQMKSLNGVSYDQQMNNRSRGNGNNYSLFLDQGKGHVNVSGITPSDKDSLELDKLERQKQQSRRGLKNQNEIGRNHHHHMRLDQENNNNKRNTLSSFEIELAKKFGRPIQKKQQFVIDETNKQILDDPPNRFAILKQEFGVALTNQGQNFQEQYDFQAGTAKKSTRSELINQEVKTPLGRRTGFNQIEGQIKSISSSNSSRGQYNEFQSNNTPSPIKNKFHLQNLSVENPQKNNIEKQDNQVQINKQKISNHSKIDEEIQQVPVVDEQDNNKQTAKLVMTDQTTVRKNPKVNLTNKPIEKWGVLTNKGEIQFKRYSSNKQPSSNSIFESSPPRSIITQESEQITELPIRSKSALKSFNQKQEIDASINNKQKENSHSVETNKLNSSRQKNIMLSPKKVSQIFERSLRDNTIKVDQNEIDKQNLKSIQINVQAQNMMNKDKPRQKTSLSKDTLRFSVLSGGEAIEVEDFSLQSNNVRSKQKESHVIVFNIKNVLEIENHMDKLSSELESQNLEFVSTSNNLINLINEDNLYNIQMVYVRKKDGTLKGRDSVKQIQTQIIFCFFLKRFFKDEKMQKLGKVLAVLEIVSINLIFKIGRMKKHNFQHLLQQMKSLFTYIHETYLLFWEQVFNLLVSNITDMDCIGRLRERIEDRRNNKIGNKKSNYFYLKQNYDLICNLIKPLIKEAKDISSELRKLFKACEENTIIETAQQIQRIFKQDISNSEQEALQKTESERESYNNNKQPTQILDQIEFIPTKTKNPKQQQQQYFLPPLLIDKMTLVLDLDETLIHFFETKSGGQFMTRPFCDRFLREMSRLYELVIFTAGTEEYANWVLDILDSNKYISFRLFRQHTHIQNGVYIKDLSKIGRDLSKTIIIDNVPENFRLQCENGIGIKSWYNDQSDSALLDLIPVLQELSALNLDDVRSALKKLRLQYPPNKVKGYFDLPK